jgi:hypothetical protein
VSLWALKRRVFGIRVDVGVYQLDQTIQVLDGDLHVSVKIVEDGL